MDETRAKAFLNDVFNSHYTHSNYEKFIVNLLNKVTINQRNYNSFFQEYHDFEGFIQDLDYFGSYTDKSGKTADILSVKLARDNSKIRARVKQRNIIARWLKKTGHDYALVAFYDDTDDWRFSFVELQLITERGEDGRVRDREQLSPARRLSFLVGKNEPNHTCKKYLLDLVTNDTTLPDLTTIRSSFSIESVSKEFFERYAGLYKDLVNSLKEVIAHDAAIKQEFKDKNVDVSEFAKKLLGQIVFIYFLQKKGWLGVPRKGKWGEGRKDFLRAVFEGEFGKYNNFFNDVLEPLFYNAFANSERDNAYYDKFDCRIPFLNGGLFEPVGSYDWVNTDIVLDNKIFKKILDTFDEFNFTIKEDEPLEKEVAVDPEMLGKIFENLLEDNLRKGYGAFYTPREIVHYMCQETLVNYLVEKSNVDREIIDALIRKGNAVVEIKDYAIPLGRHAKTLDKLLKDIRIVDPAVGSGAFPVGLLSEIVNARLILGELAHNSNLSPYNLKRETIENCLYGVDIDAGAVDIAKLRFWLALVIDEDNEDEIEPLPNLEQKIMCGDSLLESYRGVHLFDDSVIEVQSTLRYRLDEINEEIHKIYDSMENAEFGADLSISQNQIDKLKKERAKIQEQKDKGEQTTVLEGSTFGGSAAGLRLKELKQLQHDLYKETSKAKKEKIRKQIDTLEWKFIEETLKTEGHGDSAIEEVRELQKKRSKPFFLWRLNFNEVFSEKGGFDIVIGNPPYVQIQGMKEEYKVALDDENYETFTRTGDLYCLFYEMGYNLSRIGGQTALITSNSWLRSAYGEKLRNLLKMKTNVLTIIDFLDNQMFEYAIVNTNVLLFNKSLENESNLVQYVNIQGDLREKNLSDYIDVHKNIIKQNFLDNSVWTLGNANIQTFKQKIEKIGVPLKRWDIKIFRGITTGFNPAFRLDEQTKTELVKKEPQIAEFIKPIIRGREIQKYCSQWNCTYILFIPWHFPLHGDNTISGASITAETKFKELYPQTYNHLLKFKEGLSNRNKAETGIRYEWYSLQRCAATYWKFFNEEKIIWIELSDNGRFSYDLCGMYCEDTTFFMTGNQIKYLLALLNSKTINYYHSLNCGTSGMGTNRWKKIYVNEIPIPIVTEKEQQPFIDLIESILQKKKLGKIGQKEEDEIDQLVYKLFMLTDEEIKMVEEYNQK